MATPKRLATMVEDKNKNFRNTVFTGNMLTFKQHKDLRKSNYPYVDSHIISFP